MTNMASEIPEIAQLRDEIVKMVLLEVGKAGPEEPPAQVVEAIGAAVDQSLSSRLAEHEDVLDNRFAALRSWLEGHFSDLLANLAAGVELSDDEIARVAAKANRTEPFGPAAFDDRQDPLLPPKDGTRPDFRGRQGKKGFLGVFASLPWHVWALCVVMALMIGVIIGTQVWGPKGDEEAETAPVAGNAHEYVALLESTAVLDDWLRKAALGEKEGVVPRPIGEGIETNTRENLVLSLDRVIDLVTDTGVRGSPELAEHVDAIVDFREVLLALPQAGVSDETWTPMNLRDSVSAINNAARKELGLPGAQWSGSDRPIDENVVPEESDTEADEAEADDVQASGDVDIDTPEDATTR